VKPPAPPADGSCRRLESEIAWGVPPTGTAMSIT
jgi:hypothetical protein